MVCSNCKSEMENGEKFCVKCGAPAVHKEVDLAEEKTEIQTEAVEPVRQEEGAIPVQPIPQPVVRQAAVPSGGGQIGRVFFGLDIVLGILIALVAGIFIFCGLQYKNGGIQDAVSEGAAEAVIFYSEEIEA